jgi:cytochrome b involved in lipid metabolism
MPIPSPKHALNYLLVLCTHRLPSPWITAAKKLSPVSAELEATEFPMDEVKKHCERDDCWMAIGGRVFNTTAFLSEHPGGPEIMIQQAGAPRNATCISPQHS